ncbi:RES family NAD+ phosphorylase [Burkholderia sp. JPY481]
MHEAEDTSAGGLLYERIRHFEKRQVLAHFGLTLVEFLSLSRDLVAFLLEQSLLAQLSSDRENKTMVRELWQPIDGSEQNASSDGIAVNSPQQLILPASWSRGAKAMASAVCCRCIEDASLSEIIKAEGELIECSVCGETEHEAITIDRLGEIMEPIMRQHFEAGPRVKKFGANDSEWSEQEGDVLSFIVSEVLGQDFDFVDEIASAVVGAERYSPGSAEDPYWDPTCRYVPTRIETIHYLAEWHYTLDELKHGRRFFSPSARALFEKVFQGVDDLRATRGSRLYPVVRTLREGTEVFRARVCNSRSLLREIWRNPMKHVGPPPAANARTGRMNAEGVVVLYGARDARTCLAEMRPALGSEIAMIRMETTQPLRVLDFSRLDDARSMKTLSYFQDDFSGEVERGAFLRKLHGLISQPIVPGRETDYLITQTMAEYLAHVHQPPFDGILFSSAQRAGGTNIVLFADRSLLTDRLENAFRVRYLDGSVRLMSNTAVHYRHRELDVYAYDNGELWINDSVFPAGSQDWD